MACYAKTNGIIKFEIFFTDNDKPKTLEEFSEYNLKIDNDYNSNTNFDLETDKIIDYYEIKEKGFTAVASLKTVLLKFQKLVFPL